MPQLDWNIILTGLLYAALTGVFNLIFAHKSQVNAWAEANPRLAAMLKVTRALGLDPQHLWAALALLVTKKLPKVQTDPPSEHDVPVNFGPLGLLLLLGALVLPTQPSCSPSAWDAQRTAANTIGHVVNDSAEPAIIAAYRATGRAAIDSAPTIEEAEHALSVHHEKWKPLLAAFAVFKEAHASWQAAIDAKGDPVPSAIAAREAYCKARKLAVGFDVDLPQLPLMECKP